jgi:hypothetical protein
MALNPRTKSVPPAHHRAGPRPNRTVEEFGVESLRLGEIRGVELDVNKWVTHDVSSCASGCSAGWCKTLVEPQWDVERPTTVSHHCRKPPLGAAIAFNSSAGATTQ